MKLARATSLAVVAASLLALPGAAQNYVYPSRGQSPEQQQQDEFACSQWATGQTGFNPLQAPPPTQPSSASGYGGGPGMFGGAARGAALGAVGGAIGGNAGKGAAIGAAVGGLWGGMRRREAQAQQQQYAAAQAQSYQGQVQNYQRAYAACLQGRGYTVN